MAAERAGSSSPSPHACAHSSSGQAALSTIATTSTYEPPTLSRLSKEHIPARPGKQRNNNAPLWLVAVAAGTMIVMLFLCGSPGVLSGPNYSESRDCPRWLLHHSQPAMLAGPTNGINMHHSRQHRERRERAVASALRAVDDLLATMGSTSNQTSSTASGQQHPAQGRLASTSHHATDSRRRELEHAHRVLLEGRCAATDAAGVARINAGLAALGQIHRSST
jgi:hypothetical protein